MGIEYTRSYNAKIAAQTNLKHRIFIAINLPEDIKEQLLGFKKYWSDLPARWTPLENIHITLVFIGYVTDDELKNIERMVGKVGAQHGAFEVTMSRILFGPPQGPMRMIWAEIKRNSNIVELRRDLENTLYETPETGYREKENRPWSPHLTLSRFDPRDFRKCGFNPDEKFDIDFSFPVNSVQIMESVLKRTGAEYTILKTVTLLRG